MVHGDDKGLVLPPKVASVQVIVILVPYKDANTRGIFDACSASVDILSEADLRDNYSPGWKYSHWEMKDVPLRIEIGLKDLANHQVRSRYRRKQRHRIRNMQQLAGTRVIVHEERGCKALELLQQDGISNSLFFHQLHVADPSRVASLAEIMRTHFAKLDIMIMLKLWRVPSKNTRTECELATK